MKRYYFILFIVIILLVSGCSPNITEILFKNITDIYSYDNSQVDIASSLKLSINKDTDLHYPIANAWLNILPTLAEFDTGITVKHNNEEMRVTGQLGGIGELGTLLASYGTGVDIDIDLYINRSEGVFLKSIDGTKITQELLVDWSPSITVDGWISIGDANLAADVLDTMSSLKESAQKDNYLSQFIEIVDSEDSGKTHTVSTHIDMLGLWRDVSKVEIVSFINWKTYVEDFFKLTAWHANYHINENNLLSNTAFTTELVTTENASTLNALFTNIEATFIRFTYALPSSANIKPEGVYR